MRLEPIAIAAALALAACAPKDGASTGAPTAEAPATGAAATKTADGKTIEIAPGESIEVTLCDDQTKTTISAKPRTREEAMSVAQTLMAEWKKNNPETNWEAEERKSRTFIGAADNRDLIGQQGTQAPGHPYRNWTERDVLEWKRETERSVVAGSKVFHSADMLGSTIAVSCDMCHPNAANTHPETYPKYQTQMGGVALLRDMINWCLEHPVRAPRMADDDPRMKALEAYIISQRTGTEMVYGKH